MRRAKSLVYLALLAARPRAYPHAGGASVGGWGRVFCRAHGACGGAAVALAACGVGTGTFLVEPTARADGAANHVRDVRIHVADAASGSAEIEIVGAGGSAYSVRVADGGRRLLVDLQDADVAGAPAAITTPAGVIGGVLTQSYDTSAGHMARVSVSLERAASYRVVPDGPDLRVVVSPSGPPASATAVGTLATGQPAERATAPVASVQGLRFERDDKSASDRVVVDLEGAPSYALSTTPGGRPRLELRTTSLPTTLGRTLDVTAYGGPLKSITASFQASNGSTYVDIDRAGDAPGAVSVEGGKLTWSFTNGGHVQASPIAGDLRAVGKDGGPVRRIVTVAREEETKDLPRIETSIRETRGPDLTAETSGGSAAGFASSTGDVSAQQRYNGRRIDIDLKDADIHNVLRLLADTGHVNVVTGDDVSGTITIRMRNVPWDQVLDVVLQAKGLGMVRQGNLIRVAPMAQLQKERELKLAQQKQEYELTPLETRLIPISYAQADELQARARELLSPRGSIAVDERTNVLIARDVAGNLNYIEELVRSLDTQTAQVLIEARIVEATSKYLRDVGIQWGGDVTFSPATGNPTGVAFPSSVGVSGGNYDNNTPTAGLSPFQRNIANPNFAVNLPAAVGTGSGGALGMTLGSIDNAINLSVRLSALESSGLVRIVSSPRIMVLDNREARINQGTLIPFAQVSALGVQTTFQEAKLQLLVKPHVTADGSVSMHVKLNRDEPDFNQTSPRGDPTILKREAETDLLVMDGHTAVIGGIYTRNTGRNLDTVPFFGDIPILGVLFQRRRASDARNELVIFITPRIVNRSEALGR
jgi:type IV pilus assembly protein PilQ